MSKKKEKAGYGKPPKDTQFKPGRSGNPNGRPKKKQTSAASVLQEVFLAETEVVLGGRKVMMPRLAVLAERTWQCAASGDQKAMADMIKLLPYLKNDSAADTGSVDQAQFDQDRERQLLEEVARLAGVEPETLFVGDFGEPEQGDDDA